MGELRKFRQRYPLVASMLAALALVVAAITLLWSLVIPQPVVPSALYGLGRITHLSVWNVGEAPPVIVQYAALLAVALFVPAVGVLTWLFLQEWGKHADIQVTFHAPCGEQFQGTLYKFFGLMCLHNVGNEDFVMLDWSIETEWGRLHRGADADLYQSLKLQSSQHMRTADILDSPVCLLKAGSPRDTLVLVLLEQEMGKADAVSPVGKMLILQGQNQQRSTFQIEFDGSLIAIPIER